MIDLAGPYLEGPEQELILNKHVGGLILFERNFESKEQLENLCQSVRAIKENILIAVDQEGGRVQRFKEGFATIPSMQKLGDLALKDRDLGIELCKNTGWLMASEILASGLDISFAPVLDLDRDTSSVIGARAFSEMPGLTIDLSDAFIKGMNEAGMAATGKHFPGHGGVLEDSHIEAPVDTRSRHLIENHDLRPFMELKNKLGGIMTAHITYPSIDTKSVGFSTYWLQTVLRKRMGFRGVIFSDDLSMKGAGPEKSFTSRAKLSLSAGCNMILVCNNLEGVKETIDYLEKNNVTQSKRIKMMRASKKVTWQELEAGHRRKKTIEQIQALIE